MAEKLAGLSRRSFIGGAGIACIGATMGLVGCASQNSSSEERSKDWWMPESWTYETDVLVVGYGAAGPAAAIEAFDAGSEVLVIEKAPEELRGGNLFVSGNVWASYGDEEKAKAYMRLKCGEQPVDEAVLSTWGKEVMAVTDWMADLGADFDFITMPPHFPEYEGADTYTGYYVVKGGSAAFNEQTGTAMGFGIIQDVTWPAVEERGIEVIYDMPAQKLIQNPETKEIVGVVAGANNDVFIKARKGVVLACGGFENNNQMAQDYWGIPETHPQGTPFNTGDGHRMALEVGAELAHMYNYQGHPGLYTDDYECAHFNCAVYDGKTYIEVGADGTRWTNEKQELFHGRAMKNGRYQLHYTTPYWVITDEAGKNSGPIVPPVDVLRYGWNSVVLGYEWSQDNEKEVAAGWIKKSDTVEGLAKELGIDPAGLAATVSKYNAYCAEGIDPEFGRAAETMVPLANPPYYGFPVNGTTLLTTGGPRKNEKAQVMDIKGEPIPRLYVAGELSSTHSRLIDSGDMIIDSLAFGRVAGREAAGLSSWEGDNE